MHLLSLKHANTSGVMKKLASKKMHMDGWMDGFGMEPFDASFLALPMSSNQKVLI